MSAFAGIAGVALALPQPNMTRTSAAEASQRQAWQQLGDTRQSEQVTAISMSFDPDGLPVYAYGWTDGERGTRIPVVAWNGQMWVELYHRTSQFPQSYREFDFKARGNAYYLGLKISGSFGSVLNGAVEWRGSYAFHNQLFDYEIEPNGDMLMLWISHAPTNPSYPGTGDELVAVRYNASGWTGYPAVPAWGEQTVLDRQQQEGGISSLRFKHNGEREYLAAWVNGAELKVVGGNLESGFVERSSATADTVALGANGNGVACIAFHPAAATAAVEFGAVEVSCAAEGLAAWRTLGVAIAAAAVVERLAPEVVVTSAGRVVVAARSALLSNLVVVRHRNVEAEGEAEWESADLELERTATHFELGASPSGAVYLAVSENDGEGLRVFELQL